LITNFSITPHPSLQQFVDNYILSTSHGKKITLKSTWPASNETSLIFYMSDQPYHYSNEGTASPLQNERGCIVGLLSHCNGVVSFNGVYHTFIIQFKANGFNKLFRMPVAGFVNKLYYLDEVFGRKAKELNEALQNAPDIQAKACLADKFLLHFFNLHKNAVSLYDGITYISNELFNNAPLLSIHQYAYKANMSVRNFSRRFTEQTGVSPKLYCRLLRFNNAVNTRLKQPQTNWTSIAHECGYFDQMHMIKDFKEFANANPSSLFQSNTEFTRPNIHVTGAEQDLSEEKFVKVKRNLF
jgi:AraC-like DNA-binding protein